MPAPAYSLTPKISHGSTVRVGRGDTPTWTSLAGVQDVEWPDQMPADLDITNQASAGYTEENIPGILPAVDWSIDLIYSAGSATDTVLTALNARDSSTFLKELHQVEITVGAGTGAKEATFAGYLKDYRPLGPIKGVITARATWRLMARIVA